MGIESLLLPEMSEQKVASGIEQGQRWAENISISASKLSPAPDARILKPAEWFAVIQIIFTVRDDIEVESLLLVLPSN